MARPILLFHGFVRNNEPKARFASIGCRCLGLAVADLPLDFDQLAADVLVWLWLLCYYSSTPVGIDFDQIGAGGLRFSVL